MALRYSYDPLTGRLDVGFDASEEQRNAPPPNVTPEKAKTVPKPSPKGGSVPSPSPKIPPGGLKPFYRFGEEVPEGIKTRLETQEVDGKRRAVRVPILPDLTPEQQGRVNEAANSQRFTYGYDPKSGEFVTGVVDTGMDKPLVEDKTAFDKKEGADVPLTPITNTLDAADSVAKLTPLYNRKIDLGRALSKAQAENNGPEIVRLQNELTKNAEQLNAETQRRGNIASSDSLLESLSDIFSFVPAKVTKGTNNLATASTLILGESLGPMISQLPGQINAIIDASEGKKPLDAEMVGAMVPYYYGLGAADQYLGSYDKLKEQLGENLDTLPDSTKIALDKERLLLSSLGQSAIDVALGKIAATAGQLVLKPLKAASIVGERVLPKTVRRALGVTSAMAGGYSTEWGQNYLQEWGNAVDLGFLDVLDDPERRANINEGALIGGLIAAPLAGVPAAVGTARDASSIIYNKIKGRKPSPVNIVKSEDGKVTVKEVPLSDKPKPVTDLNNLDTSDLEVEVEGTPQEAVTQPKGQTLKVSEETPTHKAKPSYDMWNEYYNSRIEEFEKSQETPRTPTEIYNKGTELGLPVGDIYTKIVGDETTPIDAGTPEVRVANNVIKGVVEAAEAQKFYTDLGTDPVAQNLYLDAIADSKNNPERQEKIKRIKESIPNVPEVVLDTLSESDLDDYTRLSNRLAEEHPVLPSELTPIFDEAKRGQKKKKQFHQPVKITDEQALSIVDNLDPNNLFNEQDKQSIAVEIQKDFERGSFKGAKGYSTPYKDIGNGFKIRRTIWTNGRGYVEELLTPDGNELHRDKNNKGEQIGWSMATDTDDPFAKKAWEWVDRDLTFLGQKSDSFLQIPPAPIAEAQSAIEAVDEGNSDPAEQLKQLDQPVEPKPEVSGYNEADDPLAIPAFLDRRKNPRPLLSSDIPVPKDTLVDVQYTDPFVEGTPQEVRAAIQPYLDNLKNVAQQIGRETVGKKLTSTVPLNLVGEVNPVYADGLGGTVKERAEGEYNPERNSIYLTVASVVDDLWKTGKVSLEATQSYLTTAIHEFDHAAYMNDYFGNERTDRVFVKSIKDMKKWLINNTEYGDIISKYDPEMSKEDRAEIIAYYKQNYIEKSSSKAASDFRRAFGIPKSPDSTGKKPFLEPQGGVKLWIQKSLDVFRRIYENLKAAISGLRNVNKEMDRFFTGDFARTADSAYLNSLQRQAQFLANATKRGQSMFAVKAATGGLKKVDDPIGDAIKKVKHQASLTPEDMGDFTNYIRDPDNTYGFGNLIWSRFSWFRSLGAEARYDLDAAQVLNLADALDKAKTENLRAFGGLINWIQTITNEKGETVDKNGNPIYGKYMQVMLDLRKQKVDLNKVAEDGHLYYTNRNGKKAALTPYSVGVIKELTKAFSVPMRAMEAQNRRNLELLNSYPGSDIPVNGTVDKLTKWVEDRKKAFKDSEVGPSKEDKKHLDQAVTLIDMIVQIDDYISGNKAYVPELRKGSWGISVKDKDGNQIGLYTIEPQGGFINYAKPSQATVDKKRIEITKRYRGIDGIQVGTEAFELTNNKLAKRANAGTADLHLLLSLLSQQTQGMLTKEFNKRGIEGVSVSDIIASNANTIAENLSNASTAEGWKARFLKSRHIDGASEDWNWVMNSFFTSAASSLAYMQYKNTVDKVRSAYGKHAASSSPLGAKAKRRLEDLDYALNPGNDAAFVRGMAFMWGLGFRPSTAIIQSSPLFSLVPEDMISLGVPIYRAYGSLKGAVKYASSFISATNFKDYLKSTSYFSEQTLDNIVKYFGNNKELKSYARDAIEKDTIYLNAALVEESLGDIRRELKYTKNIAGSGKKALDNVASAGGFAMNAMERASRTGMYLAYVEEFYNNPERIKIALGQLSKEPKFTEFRRFNPDMDDVRAITTYSIQQVFGNPGKASRPRYTRGWAGALISAFMGIPAQMWEKTMQDLYGIRGLPGVKGAIVGMASSMLMFGAKAGFPTFFIVAPVLMEMFREPDEPGELQIKQMIVDLLGIKPIASYLGWSEKRVMDTIMGGMTYAVAGVDISSRVGNAMPFSNLVADTVTTLRGGDVPSLDAVTGIVGSTAANIPKAIGQILSGRMTAMEGASLVLPAFVRDLTKAGIMAAGDTLKTSSGKPLMDTTNITTGDIIAQTLGFSPKSVQDAQDRNRAVNMATSYKDSDKTRFKNQLINLGYEMRRESDPSRRYELKRQYDDLKKQFLMIAMELKKTDPERYEAFFTPKLIKRFFKDVDEGIRFRLDPTTTEGMSTNAKIKLEKNKNLLE